MLIHSNTFKSLNMEDITDADYKRAKRSWKEYRIKILFEYYDLYIQSDKFLLADVFENLRNKCIEIYEIDLPHFLSIPGLA